MFDISDSELIMLYRENNEEAANIINQKYSIIIKKIINQYYPLLKKLNINLDELTINCYEILNNALENYNSLSKASFNTYFSLIVERKIKKIIISTYRKKKNNPEEPIECVDDIIKYSENNALDPLNALCDREKNQSLNKIIIENLTNKELLVVSLLLEGLSYKDIASLLAQTYKQIYRNIQNIKRKITPELLKIDD